MTNKLKTNAFIERYNSYINTYKTPKNITSKTKFLKPYKKWLQSIYPNKKLLEIVYIKINNLSCKDIICPICKIKDKKYYTITKGYNLTCSQSCSSTLTNLKRDKETYIKQSNSIKITLFKNKKEILAKRKKNRIINGSASESEVARKAYANLSKEKKDIIRDAPIKSRLDNPLKTKETYYKLAKKLLNSIDKDGNNHYDRIHIKKLNDIDKDGNNFYTRMHIRKLNDIDKDGNNFYKRRDIRNYEKGIWTNPNDMKNFQLYSYLCRKITTQQNLNTLGNIEKRGHANKGMFHLDHKYSIFQGYKDNIPPYIIGSIYNLEMIKARNNLSKNRKCSISLDKLLEEFYK